MLGLLALSVVGLQSWRVVGAIITAEHSAVVPLPTRSPRLAMALTPTQKSSGVATPVNRASPRAVAAGATPVGGDGTSIMEASPGSAQRPVLASPAASARAATAIPSATPATPPAAAAETAVADSGGEDPSHLSIVRQVISAGVDNGDPGKSDVWKGKTDLNVLIVGVDRRKGGGDQNADVLILAHVDLVNKRVAAVSVPRDLLVDVPNVGPDKINSSYNWGVTSKPNDPVSGIAKVRDTVESVFGVPIDGYVLIDFGGFKDVIDAMGGFDINVPYAIEDDAYPTEDYGTEVVKFPAGPQHMDGATALKYVRTRHFDSDDARRKRQFQVMLALFDQGKSVRSVTHADKVILALGKSVQTSFPLDQQLSLARVALQVDRPLIRIASLAQPLLVGGYAPDGRWVYTGDMTQIVAFVQTSLSTDPATYTAGASPDPFGP